jgi:hypothetical protein
MSAGIGGDEQRRREGTKRVGKVRNAECGVRNVEFAGQHNIKEEEEWLAGIAERSPTLD